MAKSVVAGVAICLALMTGALAAAAGEGQGVDVPRANESPTFDGKLTETMWESAAKVELGYRLRTKRDTEAGVPGQRTEARLVRDDEYLYVGFVCHEPNIAGLVKSVSRYDGPVSTDDSVGVFVSPGAGPRYTSYAYRVSCSGAKHDQKIVGDETSWQSASFSGARSNDWDSGFVAAVRIGDDAWSAEMGIPFHTMDLEGRAGNLWRLNVCRYLHTSPTRQDLSWAVITGTETPGWGRLDSLLTPKYFLPARGLEDVKAERVLAPVITGASVAEWGFEDGKPFYIVEVAMTNPGGKAGEADACIMDSPFGGSEKETRQTIRIEGADVTRAAIRVAVPAPGKRTALVKLLS